MKKVIKVGKEETESSIGTKTFACTLAGKHLCEVRHNEKCCFSPFKHICSKTSQNQANFSK